MSCISCKCCIYLFYFSPLFLFIYLLINFLQFTFFKNTHIYTSRCFIDISYGWEFIYESLLYHVVRKDHRHNFSPYFYLLYLSHNSEWSQIIGLLAFLPQLLLVAWIGVLHYKDVGVSVFLQTFVFVTFNKVCTSQVKLSLSLYTYIDIILI